MCHCPDTMQIPRKYYGIALRQCEEMSKTYVATNGKHEDARIKDLIIIF
ncbi:19998_t:CDS:2 [Entrophospora sp. SA101]|nr:19998_t:CDS:2 [Entrophospora sp. SA101]